jgi:hypothetical protein
LLTFRRKVRAARGNHDNQSRRLDAVSETDFWASIND